MNKRKFTAIICSIALSSVLCAPNQFIRADVSAEVPAEATAETPVEVPATVPVETAAEASDEAPAEDPVETPAETPATATVETPAEVSVDAPAAVPVETPAETPATATVETPAEVSVEAPAAEPVETPAETPAAAPVETAAEVSVETPAEVPAVASADKSLETSVEEPVGAPSNSAGISLTTDNISEVQMPIQTDEDSSNDQNADDKADEDSSADQDVDDTADEGSSANQDAPDTADEGSSADQIAADTADEGSSTDQDAADAVSVGSALESDVSESPAADPAPGTEDDEAPIPEADQAIESPAAKTNVNVIAKASLGSAAPARISIEADKQNLFEHQDSLNNHNSLNSQDSANNQNSLNSQDSTDNQGSTNNTDSTDNQDSTSNQNSPNNQDSPNDQTLPGAENTFTLSLRNLIYDYSGDQDSDDAAATFALRIIKNQLPEAFSGILQGWQDAGSFLTRVVSLACGMQESVGGIPDSCMVHIGTAAKSTLPNDNSGSQSFSLSCIVNGSYKEFDQDYVLNDPSNRISGNAEFSVLRFADLPGSQKPLRLINDSDTCLPLSVKVHGTGSYVITGTGAFAPKSLSENQSADIQIPERSFVYLIPAPDSDADQNAQFTFTPGNVHVNAGISSLSGVNECSYNAETGVMSIMPGAFSKDGQFAMFRVEEPRSGSDNPDLHGDHGEENPDGGEDDQGSGGHEPEAPGDDGGDSHDPETHETEAPGDGGDSGEHGFPGRTDSPRVSIPEPHAPQTRVTRPDATRPFVPETGNKKDIPDAVAPEAGVVQPSPSNPGSTPPAESTPAVVHAPSSGSTPSKMKKSPKSPSNSLDKASDTSTARAAVPEADASLSARTAPVDTADRTPVWELLMLLVISGAAMTALVRRKWL